ncbi:MAG: leucine--tRNA ligase [Planctomycetia bacterium]|nr:leucine--tRNA ligase [Planctomycetia bacterium]
MSPRYEPKEIEPRWQQRWAEARVFSPQDDDPRPKKYVLEMFPYPSGSGLHLGHASNYTIADVIARYAWMKGFKVLHPMGWDAFGLPAEQYAIEKRIHPSQAVEENLRNFKGQLTLLGGSYDWTRELSTTDPAYYRWTQWIFLRLLERGLAYQAEVAVNWCPALGTVLANEEVIDGKSERGGHPVVRMPMRQWMLRITAYADRLLEGLDRIDWPENVKQMQREWIGRSVGAEVVFRVEGAGEFKVFTTRPDTLFGATFCVLAPEHPLVARITTDAQRATVSAYVEAAGRKSDRDRMADAKEKTGAFTGAWAVNPATGAKVPVWIADYVLATYGTGAIMAVPGHDARDWAFARAFGLPVVEVISGGDVTKAAHEGEGTLVHSGFLDGLPVEEAKARMTAWLEAKGLGTKAVRYKLRDWLFSRQRFWGEPIPVLHRADGTTVPLPDDALPVTLPEVPRYEPTGTGESPLAGVDAWVNTRDPRDGAPARRETNTMPGSAGSSWYFLRYIDPRNAAAFCDPAKERAWMPVDLYIGGTEHAVGHLLYARFWQKVLFDLGLVSTDEPFRRLFNQGMVVAATYRDAEGRVYPREAVETADGATRVKATGAPVTTTLEKMSKSKKNGVGIDEAVARYSGDAVRLAGLFLGPPDAEKEWTPNAIEGPWRFLLKAWRLLVGDEDGPGVPLTDAPATGALRKAVHRAIDGITKDMEAIAFNTAVSKLMVLLSELQGANPLPRDAAEAFVTLLAPFAPHAAEEMWAALGRAPFVSVAPWPVADPAALVDDTVTLAVQVNGKVRGDVTVAADAKEADVLAAAKGVENVRKHLEGKAIVKEIVVPKRLVNFVVR